MVWQRRSVASLRGHAGIIKRREVSNLKLGRTAFAPKKKQPTTMNHQGTLRIVAAFAAAVSVTAESCLDVSGVSTADGALVQLWQWLNGNNQQWAPQAP